MTEYRFVPLQPGEPPSPEEMKAQAAAFREEVARRRTVREFSDRSVPREVIEQCLLAAGTAPSGANLQPWHFVVVSDPELRRRIRQEAEVEEREFYEHRAPKEWLQALEPLGTDENKPFLETAACLIVIFVQTHGINPDGTRFKHYYPIESVGIATGLLITAVHKAGLVSLTHTPSPMRFLNEILDRPSNERPFLILVVGHPRGDAQVPDISRKPLEEIATFL